MRHVITYSVVLPQVTLVRDGSCESRGLSVVVSSLHSVLIQFFVVETYLPIESGAVRVPVMVAVVITIALVRDRSCESRVSS